MITDPEELLSKMFRAVREIGYRNDPLRLTEESHDACIDLIKQYEIRIRTESAEQARKEAAENGIIFMHERLVPGVFTDIMLDEMRAAILSASDRLGAALDESDKVR